jgi:hypothetical protein
MIDTKARLGNRIVWKLQLMNNSYEKILKAAGNG